MQPDKKNSGQTERDIKNSRDDFVRPFETVELEPFVSVLHRVEERWNWFLGIGVTLILLGMLAIAGAQFSTLFSVLFLGLLLVAGCITKFIAAFWARNWGGFWLSLLVGSLYGVMGILFLTKPIRTMEALTLAMSVIFLVAGVSKIISSLYLRFEGWGWVLASGAISILLGALLLAEWPSSSLWVIGTFLGVDLLIAGWVWVALACESRRLANLKK